MKDDIEEGCRGCLLYEICETRGSEFIEKCPCRECLIKVVCKDGCEDYCKFRSKLHERYWTNSGETK